MRGGGEEVLRYEGIAEHICYGGGSQLVKSLIRDWDGRQTGERRGLE